MLKLDTMDWFEVRSPILAQPGVLDANQAALSLARGVLEIAPYDRLKFITKLTLNAQGVDQDFLVEVRAFPAAASETDTQSQHYEYVAGGCGSGSWVGNPDCNQPNCTYEKLVQHTVTHPPCMIGGEIGSSGGSVSIQCPITNEHSYTYEYKHDGICWGMDGALWSIYCECHPPGAGRPPGAL